ncbi:hypothetical protein ODE01S_14910 [Oceanithermus desulfurans NBRC 100063]|uniref:Uncharacterized protein n=1 Tax=Oceanithermus desulfurans NBRC 100063 TaxID=1227550 RepID=A0A511RLV8_9DEIN|nr:hypothetical protein ODE01S_14910 [Oceanithermus desulfurans NBRC 100063]
MVLILALAACNTQIKPQATQADFDQSVQDYQADLGAVAAAAGQDLALQALMATPSGAPGLPTGALAANLMNLGAGPLSPSDALKLLGGIVPLADQNLERGKWDYDPAVPGWVQDSNYSGDDLVLTWPFDDDQSNAHTAALTFDWNYGAATVDVRESDGTTSEAPQDMQITLRVDGNAAGSLHGQFAWYDCSGTPIAEPTSVALSGSAGVNDRVAFTFNLSASDTRIQTSGSFSVTAGGDSSSLSWDVWVNGAMTRDASCFSQDFDASGGHVNFATSESVGGESQSFEFNTDFTLNFDAGGNPISAVLANGFVKVDGTVALTFSGTLDDANGNCVPGENVSLVFADGSLTLEQYLIAQGATPGCD